ncbi:MAG: DUF3566 domain-containing protein [Maribacter sp.]|nr:DUF3566 domain-containing protein [Maribacter sp.]
MEKVKKIGVFSFAKFQGYLAGLIGLICGMLYSFGGLVIDILVSAGLTSAIEMETPGLSFGTVLAFGVLIGMPLIFAVAGFLLGLVEAVLYNLVARWFGGLKIDFDREKQHARDLGIFRALINKTHLTRSFNKKPIFTSMKRQMNLNLFTCILIL